ncbi:hypothetical protein F0L68_17280 [Solihabitans fulvus]|uniref:TrbL/VirB6 plasmid conjugal transfer protein n=1 Tax=Solihabitans fulvus TaxID=1892852 RepID=A0A5B2XEE5_9PSEU|nr:hypothetical protein [Solihabitans fulvus]KAA2261524.1 hypothetical protein F0L68_17280 [Solihabitans fulvus]
MVDISCEVNDWFHNLVKDFARASADFLGEAASWWTKADQSSILHSSAVGIVHSLLSYVGLAMLTCSIIWQATVLVIKRKPDPLVNTATGLLQFVAWSTLGATVTIMTYEAGIALASQVLGDSIKHFAEAMGAAITSDVAAVALILLLALILMIVSGIHWIIGFLRIGALVILLALMPTAAAGSLNEATKPWLKKVLSWTLALDLYQPLAAIIFSIGFVLVGNGASLSQLMTGLAVLVLAVLAMPVMLRFFDWGGQQLTTGHHGGGGSGAAMAATGASMTFAGRSQGGGGGGMAQYMDATGPSGGGVGGSRPSGAQTTLAAANTGTGPCGGQPTPASASGGNAGNEGEGVNAARPGSSSTGSGTAPSGSSATTATSTGTTAATQVGTGAPASSASGSAGGGSAAAGAGGAAVGAAVVAAQVAQQAGQQLGRNMTDGADHG